MPASRRCIANDRRGATEPDVGDREQPDRRRVRQQPVTATIVVARAYVPDGVPDRDELLGLRFSAPDDAVLDRTRLHDRLPVGRLLADRQRVRLDRVERHRPDLVALTKCWGSISPNRSLPSDN